MSGMERNWSHSERGSWDSEEPGSHAISELMKGLEMNILEN